MSIYYMNAAWSTELQPTQKLVLLAIADRANDDGICWPGQASLARKCGVTDRTIRTIIKELEEVGFLEVQNRQGNGFGRKTNVYKLSQPEEFSAIGNRKSDAGNRKSDAGNRKQASYNSSEDTLDNPPETPKKRKWTDDDMELAKQILAIVKKSSPSAKLGAKWADDIRLMRERDNHSHQEIAIMFQFANNHPFWKTNILSPGKLRDKWVQLEAEQSRYKDKPMPGESPKEARERIRASGLQVVKPKYLNDLWF